MIVVRLRSTPGEHVGSAGPGSLRCHPARHLPAFIAATPVVRRRYRGGQDKRVQGHSYPESWYEDAIGYLLAEVGGVDNLSITEAVRLYGEVPDRADELTLARIEGEREEASQRLAKTRDIAAWQATMVRLDAEAEVARQPQVGQGLTPTEVVSYLRSLPTLWADVGPEVAKLWPSPCSPRPTCWGSNGWSTNSRPMRSNSASAPPCRPVFEIGNDFGEFGRGERI